MSAPQAMVPLAEAALDRMLPLHLTLSPTGHILHAGPTLRKIAGAGIVGRRFLEAFEVRRPRYLATARDLLDRDGGRLQLALRDPSRLALKGLALPTGDGGILLNLSFGIAVVEAIASRGLSGADFAPTDLSVEMLYLAEARASVMREAMRLNERLEEARRQAERMAMSDTLTGLGNRRAMDEAMQGMLARGVSFGLMHLDLDYFKDVNDTMGHAAGDAVLGEVARVLQSATREEDVVARVGGDEFVVICRGLTDTGVLGEIAWRIITELERPIPWGKRACRISGSIGITTTELYERPDADVMLGDADQALYASKRGGRATVTVFGAPPVAREVTRSAG